MSLSLNKEFEIKNVLPKLEKEFKKTAEFYNINWSNSFLK
jgi:hypothetical protein